MGFALLVAAVGLGGCAADGSPTDQGGAAGAPGQTTPPVAAPGSPPPTHASEPVASPQERADAAVLTQDDLGPAWEPEPFTLEETSDGADGSQPTDNPACDSGQELELVDGGLEGHARSKWWFSNDTASEMVTSTAYVYASTDEAAAAIERLRVAAGSCVAWQAGGINGIDGQEYAFSYAQMLFDAVLGDEGLGIEKSVGAIRFPDVPPTSTFLVVVQLGEIVQTTSFVSSLPGVPGISMVIDHAETALGRLGG